MITAPHDTPRPLPSPVQIRLLAARPAESLRDVHRVAESRGARLPAPPYDPDDDLHDPGDHRPVPRIMTAG